MMTFTSVFSNAGTALAVFLVVAVVGAIIYTMYFASKFTECECRRCYGGLSKKKKDALPCTAMPKLSCDSSNVILGAVCAALFPQGDMNNPAAKGLVYIAMVGGIIGLIVALILLAIRIGSLRVVREFLDRAISRRDTLTKTLDETRRRVGVLRERIRNDESLSEGERQRLGDEVTRLEDAFTEARTRIGGQWLSSAFTEALLIQKRSIAKKYLATLDDVNGRIQNALDQQTAYINQLETSFSSSRQQPSDADEIIKNARDEYVRNVDQMISENRSTLDTIGREV